MKTPSLISRSLHLFLLSGLFLFISCETDNNELIESESLDLRQEVVTESEFSSSLIKDQYIVVYNDNGKMPQLLKVRSSAEYKTQMSDLKNFFVNEFQLKKENIKATYGYSIKGFAAVLTEDQVKELKNDPRVLSVEEDTVISLGRPSNPGGGGGGGGGGNPPAQEVSYGTARVGGGNGPSGNIAWIIDSGIDLDHPDLNVDVANSISFLSGSPSNQTPDDGNGHGTHVAGTIAAIDNSIGTKGVAPGNTVVAVRVLDKRGSGSTSGVIEGVDYVAGAANSGDVANMSLGGGVSSTLDNAVIAAAATGVKFVLAAGNESDDANYHSPARANHNNIYTISAMDSNDNWAYFSNYGSPVDYCAPGVGILSLWKSGGVNTISGTSMAAPHAAGVLLFGNPSSDGTVNGDPDGNPDAIIHL